MAGEHTEPQLVARAQAGDREAFASLIQRYQQPVGGYLWRLTGDREVARDLTQDTFLRAYRAIGATRPGLRLRAWLYRIATNLAYDHFRRQRRFAWVPLLPAEGPPAVDEPAGVEEADAVWRALALLRPKDRAVLLVCALEGYSYREAAEILGGSAGAVRKQLARARERFRRAYGRQAGAPGSDPAAPSGGSTPTTSDPWRAGVADDPPPRLERGGAVLSAFGLPGPRVPARVSVRTGCRGNVR